MKNLKKTLAMVLVVATMLSILVIGAGAAFTDQADVDYAEAVDVLSSIKVLEGFEDGSFKPDEILTREQAAKIIAYAMLGKTAADALATQTAPFSDVAATRWSAGYITFCANQGIINGYGDGRFGPADTLTGFQFAKMLLTAIGYGKNDEFVGSNWTIEVAKFAIPLGIFDGNTAGASNAPCTREAAALYTFNAMTKAMVVNYSEILGTYYAGTNALNSPVTLVEEFTLGYQVYRLLADDAQQGGRSGHRWTVNGVYITGFYGDDTVITTSTDGTELYNLVTKGAKGFKAELDDNYYVYYNGVGLPNAANVYAGALYFDAATRSIKEDDGDGIANSDDAVYPINRGAIVELIDTDDLGNKVDVINIIEKSIAFFSSAPQIDGDYVVLPAGAGTYLKENCIGYDKITAYSYVAYVVIDGVITLETCASFNGTLTSIVTSATEDTYYVIGGKNYYLSELVSTPATVNEYTRDVTYYLDPTGYIVASLDMGAPSSQYGLILDAAGSNFSAISGQGTYAKVQLLKSDGTVEVFDLVNATTQLPDVAKAQTLATNNIGDICKYKVNSAGKIYEISEGTDITNVSVTTSSSTVSGTGLPAGHYANASTYFFFYDADGNIGGTPLYSVVKGYASVPTVSAATGQYIISNTDSFYRAVLLEGVAAPGAVDVAYITDTNFSTATLENGTLYYVYKCVLDGKAGTINLASQINNGVGAYYVTKLSNGLYSTTLVPNNTSQINACDAGYFVLNGVTYKIGANTAVYKLSYDLIGNVIVEKTALTSPVYYFNDVYLTAFDAVYDGTGWLATCVFYEYPSAWGKMFTPLSSATITSTELSLDYTNMVLSRVINATGFANDTTDKVDLTAAAGYGSTAKVYVMKAGTNSFAEVTTLTGVDIADAAGTAYIKIVCAGTDFGPDGVYVIKINVTA